MSAQEIRAGRAFVEVTIRDRLQAGLTRAQTRLAAFAMQVQVMGKALASGMKLVGESLTRIGTTLAGIGGGITALMAKSVQTFLQVSAHARKLNKDISGIDPSKAERLQTALDGVRAVFGAIQFRIGEALAEPLTRVLEVLIQLGAGAARFIQQNQGLVLTIAAVGAVALVAGVAIAALGLAFSVAGAALAAIVVGIAALMTPVGLAVAGVAALIAIVLGAGVAFVALNGVAQQTFLGIAAAIANGNIAGAFQIVVAGLKVLWESLMFAMTAALMRTIQTITSQFNALVQNMATRLRVLETGLSAAFGRDISLGSGALAGLGNVTAGINSATQAAGNAAVSAASSDLAAATARFSGLIAKQKAEFLSRFGGGLNLAALTQGGETRGGFGVAGTFSGAVAGQLRASNIQEQQLKEDKKANELLDRILKAIEGLDTGAAVEFS